MRYNYASLQPLMVEYRAVAIGAGEFFWNFFRLSLWAKMLLSRYRHSSDLLLRTIKDQEGMGGLRYKLQEFPYYQSAWPGACAC